MMRDAARTPLAPESRPAPATGSEPHDRDNGHTVEELRRDVLEGLAGTQKRIPSKYFYDAEGSRLFEQICDLPEYYLTRTELGIMRDFAGSMAEVAGPGCALIELGSGASVKTRLLLDRLRDCAGYVPVDISGEHLHDTVRFLREEYPALAVLPVAADFTTDFDLPHLPPLTARKLAYFPGSTIGNFDPVESIRLLRGIARLVGPHGALLLGADLRKSRTILEAAYNDAQGVTARFNRNLLVRIRTELGAELDPEGFAHHAFYNEAEGRVEMHLVSLGRQTITLEGERFELDDGETIHTENSYKYDLDVFGSVTREAGFRRTAVWTDAEELFSVQFLERA